MNRVTQSTQILLALGVITCFVGAYHNENDSRVALLLTSILFLGVIAVLQSFRNHY